MFEPSFQIYFLSGAFEWCIDVLQQYIYIYINIFLCNRSMTDSKRSRARVRACTSARGTRSPARACVHGHRVTGGRATGGREREGGLRGLKDASTPDVCPNIVYFNINTINIIIIILMYTICMPMCMYSICMPLSGLTQPRTGSTTERASTQSSEQSARAAQRENGDL